MQGKDTGQGALLVIPASHRAFLTCSDDSSSRLSYTSEAFFALFSFKRILSPSAVSQNPITQPFKPPSFSLLVHSCQSKDGCEKVNAQTGAKKTPKIHPGARKNGEKEKGEVGDEKNESYFFAALPVLTDTGNEVMEDVLGEQGVLQASEIELEDSCYGIHVVVILVPSQGILPFRTRREKIRAGQEIKLCKKRICVNPT